MIALHNSCQVLADQLKNDLHSNDNVMGTFAVGAEHTEGVTLRQVWMGSQLRTLRRIYSTPLLPFAQSADGSTLLLRHFQLLVEQSLQILQLENL